MRKDYPEWNGVRGRTKILVATEFPADCEKKLASQQPSANLSTPPQTQWLPKPARFGFQRDVRFAHRGPLRGEGKLADAWRLIAR